MKKPPKIKNLDEQLAKFPEEDREEIKASILEAFADFDPSNPPGRVVKYLPGNPKICPSCQKPLQKFDHGVTEFPDGTLVEVLECTCCDFLYSVDALS